MPGHDNELLAVELCMLFLRKWDIVIVKSYCSTNPFRSSLLLIGDAGASFFFVTRPDTKAS